MILEIADIRIHAGQNAAFEAAIAKGSNRYCQFPVNPSVPQTTIMRMPSDGR